MGIYIYSCAVNAEKIEQTYKSNDETLIKKALEEAWFDHFKEYSIEQALTDIIFGKPYKDNVAHVYGYAVITLCHVLGQELPYSQDIKLGFETDIINQVLTEDFHLEHTIEDLLMPDNDDFSFIPPPIDFPLIAVHRQSDLQQLAKLFENVKITQEMIDNLQDSEDEDEEEKGYAYEHIKGIIENIHFCLENQLDMVSFCH